MSFLRGRRVDTTRRGTLLGGVGDPKSSSEESDIIAMRLAGFLILAGFVLLLVGEADTFFVAEFCAKGVIVLEEVFPLAGDAAADLDLSDPPNSIASKRDYKM